MKQKSKKKSKARRTSKMSTDAPRTMIVIGCGGIFSYLWKPLMRMLSYTKAAPKRVVLIDGDQFVASNLERQDMIQYDIMRNKADVYVERIQQEFKDLKVQPLQEFVTHENIGIISEDSLVLSCVDNHATRKLLADHARTLKNCIVLTGASDMVNGNVHVHIVKNGKEITEGIDTAHPEVAAGKDRNPGEMNCEERARLPGGGQQIASNVFTAALMVAMLWKLFDPKAKDLTKQNEVLYDLNHLVMDSAKGEVQF